MRPWYLLLLSIVLGLAQGASAQRICLLDEGGQPATGARIEVLGQPGQVVDLGSEHCADLSVVLSDEGGGTVPGQRVLDVFPTVTAGKLTVDFTSRLGGPSSISLYDLLGRRVFSGSQTIPAGRTRFDMRLGGLAPGAYMLVVENGGTPTARQVFVAGSLGGATRIDGAGPGPPVPSAMVARKSRSDEVRITRYGSGQIVRALTGSNQEIMLPAAHRLSLDARMATSHNVRAAERHPGVLRVEELRSGLVHEIAYTGPADPLLLPSDSTRISYIAPGVAPGPQAIRSRAEDGWPGGTLTASLHPTISGPLYLPRDHFESGQTSAYLFVVPESFDMEAFITVRTHWKPSSLSSVYELPFYVRPFHEPELFPRADSTGDRLVLTHHVSRNFSSDDQALIDSVMTHYAPALFDSTLFQVIPKSVGIRGIEESTLSIVANSRSGYDYYTWALRSGHSIDTAIYLQQSPDPRATLNAYAVLNLLGDDGDESLRTMELIGLDYRPSVKASVAVIHAIGPISSSPLFYQYEFEAGIAGLYHSLNW